MLQHLFTADDRRLAPLILFRALINKPTESNLKTLFFCLKLTLCCHWQPGLWHIVVSLSYVNNAAWATWRGWIITLGGHQSSIECSSTACTQLMQCTPFSQAYVEWSVQFHCLMHTKKILLPYFHRTLTQKASHRKYITRSSKQSKIAFRNNRSQFLHIWGNSPRMLALCPPICARYTRGRLHSFDTGLLSWSHIWFHSATACELHSVCIQTTPEVIELHFLVSRTHELFGRHHKQLRPQFRVTVIAIHAVAQTTDLLPPGWSRIVLLRFSAHQAGWGSWSLRT